jgi:hypothetical protein
MIQPEQVVVLVETRALSTVIDKMDMLLDPGSLYDDLH